MGAEIRRRIGRLAQPQRSGWLADALRAAEKDLERIAALPEADLRILAEDASQSFADRQTALSRLLQITQGAEQAHWRERLQAVDAEELEAMRQALSGPLSPFRRALYESILANSGRS